MADIELVIKIPEGLRKDFELEQWTALSCMEMKNALMNGTPLPKGHGRLGDLGELEQRISNFVEHDAKITDEYTVARQRFIVDGIRETPTIIEADKEQEDGD